MNEDDLIHWLKGRAQGLGGDLIGDDAAMLPAGGPWVSTIDSQIEGVHFLPGTDPALLARRLLAVNLSDLAAMGAEPAYGFLALSTPASFDHCQFFEAFLDACSTYGVQLAGGDLSTQPTITMVLTLIGHQVKGGRFVERRTACPGHRLWIGGAVGESAVGLALIRRGAGLLEGEAVDVSALGILDSEAETLARRCVTRHLLPAPQLELGRWLAQTKACAAIDISDGLAKDLHRLCRASQVGAEIELDAICEPAGWQGLQNLVEKEWLNLALAGGEDYVLCFTLPENQQPPKSLGARCIGRIRSGNGVTTLQNGQSRPLGPQGWDHLEG